MLVAVLATPPSAITTAFEVLEAAAVAATITDNNLSFIYYYLVCFIVRFHSTRVG
jgi:hypothetical protein